MSMLADINSQKKEYLLSADRYPHLRNYVESYIDQDNTLRLDLNIDSSHHTYLKDHVFGNNSFVPATMIIELLFEAALFYSEYHLNLDVENLKPAKLVDFSILRAIAMLPGDSLKVQFLFKRVIKKDSEIEFDMEIISQKVNKANVVLGIRQNTTSKVVLSYERAKSPDFNIPEDRFTYYQLPKDIFYEYYFPSLGPLFQSSCARFAVNEGKNRFVGEYDCLGKERSFIQGQSSEFLTSPLGNDSCLQYAVFFSRIINLTGRLPIGGKELRFYKKHPSGGSVKVFVECIAIDDDMVSNIYSFDSSGVIFHAREFIVKKSPYHTLMDRDKFDRMLNKYETSPFAW